MADLLSSAEMIDSSDSETITSRSGSLTCFECKGEACLDDRISSELCTDAIVCWKSSVRNANGSEMFSRGCTKVEDVPLCSLAHQTALVDSPTSGYHISCCSENFCNNGTFPVFPSSRIRNDTSPDQQSNLKIFELVGLLTIIMLGIIVYLRWNRRKRIVNQVDESSGLYPENVITDPAAIRENPSKKYLELSSSSGSGRGLSHLTQQTLARQISLVEIIGKGRYGEVWRGTLHDCNVAVKIFFSKDEVSWSRETEIYKTVLLRHSNILNFISSDIKSQNSMTQLWLVTEYHKFGSLYDYLNLNSLNYAEMFTICSSIANGIFHLHTEIFGEPEKPAIAHRDIKSKNILVTVHGECVLADFGLAVTYHQKLDKMSLMPTSRVGTKRYMAPEVLDETLNLHSIESFKRADIYALGLVLWETCRRTVSNGIVEEHQPPFYEYVTSDPSFDDMRKIVCIDKRRPEMPDRWLADEILRSMCSLINECWHTNPSVRPTSLRVKKNIMKLKIC